MEKNSKIKVVSLLFSILIYAISLTKVGFVDQPGDFGNDNVGLYLVIFGAIGFTAGGAALSWLANPLLWFSWIRINNAKLSFKTSLTGTLFSLSFLFFEKVATGTPTGTDVAGPVSPESYYRPIVSLEIGYYLWLSSCFILFIGNSFRLNIFHRLCNWMKYTLLVSIKNYIPKPILISQKPPLPTKPLPPEELLKIEKLERNLTGLLILTIIVFLIVVITRIVES